jgi:hypothetical protein
LLAVVSDKAQRHYLCDAIEAAPAGEPAPEAETPPVGCTLKWTS